MIKKSDTLMHRATVLRALCEFFSGILPSLVLLNDKQSKPVIRMFSSLLNDYAKYLFWPDCTKKRPCRASEFANIHNDPEQLRRVLKRLQAWKNTLEWLIYSEDKQIKGQAKRKRRRKLGPLTKKQVETAIAVFQSNFNISAAAKMLGKDRKTIKQHYDMVLQKLGLNPTNFKKEIVKMQKLPEDKRGQVYLASKFDTSTAIEQFEKELS